MTDDLWEAPCCRSPATGERCHQCGNCLDHCDCGDRCQSCGELQVTDDPQDPKYGTKEYQDMLDRVHRQVIEDVPSLSRDIQSRLAGCVERDEKKRLERQRWRAPEFPTADDCKRCPHYWEGILEQEEDCPHVCGIYFDSCWRD